MRAVLDDCCERLWRNSLLGVVPAKAGTQNTLEGFCIVPNKDWIPAFAGMTECWSIGFLNSLEGARMHLMIRGKMGSHS